MAFDYDYFKNLEEIGGHLLCDSIKSLILYDSDNNYVNIHMRDPSRIKIYASIRDFIDVLLNMNDDEFHQIYIDFEDVDVCIVDYVYACLSNYELIKRCLSISVDILRNAFKLYIYDDDLHVNFDIRMCKLLRENKFKLECLLLIAYDRGSVELMTYLIDDMTRDEIKDILLDNIHEKYNGVLYIIIMDKIHNDDTELKSLVIDKICIMTEASINDAYFDDEYINVHNLIIVNSYCVIKCMNITQCKKYIIDLNDIYIASIMHSPQLTAQIIEYQKFHNSLLEFTVKPRGMRTKQARNY
jgi:hypothetical protein